ASEAAGVVTKILNFENDPGGDSWKKRMVLIADDEFGRNSTSPSQYLCWTGQNQFKAACESVAVIARDFSAVPVDTVKHYLERCLVDDQPSVREAHGCPDYNTTVAYTSSNCTPALVQDLNAGAFMVNFQGHANRWQFTHEQVLYDFNPRKDILGLTNRTRPFIFIGFGCWISDFQWLAEPILTEAIGEKFLLNPNGAACASFASGCSEPIIYNQAFNGYVTRAFLTHLQGKDAHGADIPARVLMGEAVMTALLRYGRVDYIEAHILLGDPAMVVDLGPPLLTVSVDDMVIDESYVHEGLSLDTLHIATEIRDEEAITDIRVEIVEDDVATTVSPDDYLETAILDTGFVRSRAYMVTYDHVPLLGDYVVRISGTDYADKASSFDIHVSTGSAGFYADGKVLVDGGKLVFGQHLGVLITRPVAFGEDDIEVRVDSVSGDEYEDYSVEMKDGAGKQWQVSFIPSLAAGEHDVHVSVQGFKTVHRFEYVPAHIEFFVNDRPLYDGDYVSPRAEFKIMLRAETGLTKDDVAVDLDGEPVDFAFAPDSSGWRVTFALDLDTGDHELSVTLFSVTVAATFTVSAELMLTDVSAFPNPFSNEVYFFYTLSQEVRQADLSIFTVSGRLIRETRMTPFVGYNEFVWDGRDDRGDRIANGTYLYRVIATSGSGEKEFTGWVVKLE
ncbi:MAG: C25 family cysteine peptidase, partial [Candidatus Eisenbacteria bacterium]